MEWKYRGVTSFIDTLKRNNKINTDINPISMYLFKFSDKSKLYVIQKSKPLNNDDKNSGKKIS